MVDATEMEMAAELAYQATNPTQTRSGDFATIPMPTTGMMGINEIMAAAPRGTAIAGHTLGETYTWGGDAANVAPTNNWPTAPQGTPIGTGYAEAHDAPAVGIGCYGNVHRFTCDHEAVCQCGACTRVPPAMWAVPRGL